jgi:endonuclease YncB( thermonuclease family)
VVSVWDGDTLHLDIDLGLDQHTLKTIRLYGINAPELNTAEGHAAKDALVDLLTDRLGNWLPITLETIKDHREKYGRYLGVLEVPDGTGELLEVNREMVERGFAVPYMV